MKPLRVAQVVAPVFVLVVDRVGRTSRKIGLVDGVGARCGWRARPPEMYQRQPRVAVAWFPVAASAARRDVVFSTLSVVTLAHRWEHTVRIAVVD